MFVLTTTTNTTTITLTTMTTLGIFELLAGGISALVSAYAVGRMFYVAATAPTKVRRIVGHVGYEDQEYSFPGYASDQELEATITDAALSNAAAALRRVSLRQSMAERH